MTAALDELLEQLTSEERDLRAASKSYIEKATGFERDANLIAERIRGIKEAREALAAQVPEPAEQPPARRQRRDIRALVAAELEAWPASLFGPEYFEPAAIAERIGCRKSQVEAAMAHLRKADPTEDLLG